MTDSLSSIRNALDGTTLSGRAIAEVKVPNSREVIFAIDVNGTDAVAAWRLLRARADVTGRWPVLTMLHSNRSDPWDRQLSGADILGRFYFKEERRDGRRGDGPAEIVEASVGLDLAEQFGSFRLDPGYDIEAHVETALQETQRQFGQAPPVGDPLTFLVRESIGTFKALEWWFFQWEIDHCRDPLALGEHGLSHLEWFELMHECQALLLMPSLRGWETPAYVNWFASYLCNSQFVVALLKEWNTRFGAELVAHYGTMLQFQVSRRPSSAEEAFELAWQQHMVSPCTTLLPGVSIRNHARALLHTDKWFLHERP